METTMEYNLIVNQEKKSINAAFSGQTITLKTGNTVYEASFAVISDHQILLTVNGQHINAFIHADGDMKTMVINGRSYQVQDADRLIHSASRGKNPAAKDTAVTSPMPAVVISVLIRAGERVEKGQGLVIVSAMKMETTLFAPFNGIVSSINAKEGDKIMPADILVEFENKETT